MAALLFMFNFTDVTLSRIYVSGRQVHCVGVFDLVPCFVFRRVRYGSVLNFVAAAFHCSIHGPVWFKLGVQGQWDHNFYTIHRLAWPTLSDHCPGPVFTTLRPGTNDEAWRVCCENLLLVFWAIHESDGTRITAFLLASPSTSFG